MDDLTTFPADIDGVHIEAQGVTFSRLIEVYRLWWLRPRMSGMLYGGRLHVPHRFIPYWQLYILINHQVKKKKKARRPSVKGYVRIFQEISVLGKNMLIVHER